MKRNLLFLLLLSNTFIFAQDSFTLSGFIREAESSEDLIGANVVCENLKIGATTNAYGFYSIRLPEGTHTIRYSFIGYVDQVFDLSVSEDKKRDVFLQNFAEQLTEVVLEDEANVKVRSI